jgi:imidazolonepropionase-like amidohydrolase
MRQDDDYDQAFKIPAQLHEAGVDFCFASFGATGIRNLPFDAGQAVAFGLPKDVALRAMTLSAAEILGVADRIGSLEVGKAATMIVSDGDIMDLLTHKVTRMFIDGRVVGISLRENC